MVIGEVVGEVVFSGTPVDYELALLDYVADPIKAHVYGFGATLFYRFIGDDSIACIVGLDGCGGLWMSHLFESDAERNTVTSIVEDGAEFCFCGRGHDIAHDGAACVDGAVVWRRCGGGAVGLGAVGGSWGFELRKKVPPAWLLALASDK
jgi:hypothetical protein